ncbi:MAG: hypothetical protein ABSF77_08230 [Spirochaetia bacterium]|jgi:hypothetical protein
MNVRASLLLAALLLLLPAAVFGTAYTWTGGGDGTSWNVSGNWSGGASYPQAGDTATIALASAAVNMNVVGGVTIDALTINSATATLTLSYDLSVTNGDITITSGTLGECEGASTRQSAFLFDKRMIRREERETGSAE